MRAPVNQDVPIGSYQGKGLSPDAYYQPYVDDLVDNFPSPIKNNSQVPDALSVYRSVLAAQPDYSVTISSIGLLTNLADLLASPADDASPLTGYDLVAAKVKYLAVMGGKYPSSEGQGAECNFCGGGADDASLATSREATAAVVGGMPPSVAVVYSGFEVGIDVQSGGRLSSCAPEDSPCRRAFEDYEGGPNKSRFSWDPLSTLAAVRGWANASCADSEDYGTNTADAGSGENAWVSGTKTNQTYLVLVNGTAAGDALDDLLCQTPKYTKNQQR